MPDFVCVFREPEFSPGKAEADAAILLNVAGLLRRERYVVDIVDPRARRWPELSRRTVVLSMAQGEKALLQLQHWERLGVRVINSVAAVRNCHRARTLALWQQAGCRFPQATLLSTDQTALPEWVAKTEGVWVKRGDVHAMMPEDVQFVSDREQVLEVLRQFHGRGIGSVVLQRHIAGCPLKFYGVIDRFFRVMACGDGLHAEVERQVAAMARQAATALGLEVFGGDCIVDESGGCHLIDLNDWPSYAPCRQAAAEAIAAYARREKAKVA